MTLSIEPRRDVETSTARAFWGPIQQREEYGTGAEPTTIEVSAPEKLGNLDAAATEDLAFHPRVCRVTLPGEHRGGHVYYHDISEDRRPPRDEELPT